MKRKAEHLGVFSALIASVCCLGPLVLILLGLSGLGLGAILGKYHLYFILGAALLLAFAWKSYLKEKKSCEVAQCEMSGKNKTRNVLILASAVVTFFAALNLYTVLKPTEEKGALVSGTQISIPVKGMSCFTCEIAVRTAVKKLPGVIEVKANARDERVIVIYDPEKVSLDELLNAINKTGYKAERPKL